MSVALTVCHEIAAPSLEVLSANLVAKATSLTIAADALTVLDKMTFEVGNRVLIDLHQIAKEIEARRVFLKKPITQLGRSIDEVVAQASEPLEAAKRVLKDKVMTYERAEQAKAEKARLEAEAAARKEREEREAEQRRLQAEADAKHAEEVAAATAKAKAEAAELEAILGKPVVAEPVSIPAVKVELPKPAAPIAVIAEAPKATALQTRKVMRAVITDIRAIFRFIADGGPTDLAEVSPTKLKEIMDAGVLIPGAELEMVEITAMNGRR